MKDNLIFKIIFTFSLETDIEHTTCTAHGHHNVTELFLRGSSDQCGAGFKEVISRCNEENTIEFIQDCDGFERNSIFYCLGGWERTVPYVTLPGEPGYTGGGGGVPYGQFGGRGFGTNQPGSYGGGGGFGFASSADASDSGDMDVRTSSSYVVPLSVP